MANRLRRRCPTEEEKRGWIACVLACLGCFGAAAPATAGSWVYDDPSGRHNSVFAFGGRMSTGDFASTSIFNQNYSNARQGYDNSIAGVSYERDVYDWGEGWLLGAEIGAADRFGHYQVCCGTVGADATQYSASELNSYEVWLAPTIRWERIPLGKSVRMSVAISGGFSYVTSAIGRERQREIDYNGNAHLLFYGAYELGFSSVSYPNVAIVYRLAHRSGMNGILGRMREGYNANLLGLRYRF